MQRRRLAARCRASDACARCTARWCAWSAPTSSTTRCPMRTPPSRATPARRWRSWRPTACRCCWPTLARAPWPRCTPAGAGTAANVVGATVATLTREWGVDPATLVAAIGPSIGACCYTVGPELQTAFEQAGHSFAHVQRWFTRNGDALVLDLWAANRDLLEAAGVPAANIHVAGLCTKTHREVFESFRADGDQAGRMAAIIVAPRADGGARPG